MLRAIYGRKYGHGQFCHNSDTGMGWGGKQIPRISAQARVSIYLELNRLIFVINFLGFNLSRFLEEKIVDVLNEGVERWGFVVAFYF